MITLVSWTGFWISHREVTARVVLSTLSLFVLAIQVADVNKSFPSTTYTKSVDTWTGICLTFVFFALLEFCTVHYMTKQNERKSSKNSKRNSQLLTDAAATSVENNDDGEEHEIPLKDVTPGEDDIEKQDQGAASTSVNLPTAVQRVKDLTIRLFSDFQSYPKRMDVASRIAFPVMFLIFNIIYWPVASL